MKQTTDSYAPSFPLILAGLLALGTTGCEREALNVESLTATEREEARGTQRPNQYRLVFENEEQIVGESGEIIYTVLPGPDLKINLEFPWKVEFESETGGLTMGKRTFDLEAIELTEEAATIRIPVVPESAGRHEVNGYANFSVCNDDRCDIFQREPVRFVVNASGERAP